MDIGTMRNLALLACVGVIVGAIGPWYTSLLVDVSGLDSNGKITLVLAIGAGALVLARPPGSPWLILAALLATASAFLGGLHLNEIYTADQELFGQQVKLVGPGWGLWLTTVGSVLLAGGAAALWVNVPAESSN